MQCMASSLFERQSAVRLGGYLKMRDPGILFIKKKSAMNMNWLCGNDRR